MGRMSQCLQDGGKIQALLVEKEAHAKSKKHSSACLVWAVAGRFVWTKNSMQVTEAEDKATEGLGSCCEDPCLMCDEIWKFILYTICKH